MTTINLVSYAFTEIYIMYVSYYCGDYTDENKSSFFCFFFYLRIRVELFRVCGIYNHLICITTTTTTSFWQEFIYTNNNKHKSSYNIINVL